MPALAETPAEAAGPPPVRRPELDAVRVAAMAGVVAIHALAWPLAHAKGTAFYVGCVVAGRVLNALCVPAFLFLTGLLTWGAASAPERHTRGWWARRLRVVFVPYLAWSAAYLVARPYIYPSAETGSSGLVGVASRLLTGSSFYHLYFPPLLLVVYALAPSARSLLARRPAALVLAALGAQAVLIAALRTLPLVPDVRALLSNATLLAPFPAAGALYARWERAGSPHAAAVLAAGAAGLALVLAQASGVLVPAKDLVAGYPLREAGILAVAVALAAGAHLSRRYDWERVPQAAGWLRRIAAHSYGVYLAHPLVLAFAAAGLTAVFGPSALGRPGVVMAAYSAVVLATLALVRTLRRTPATGWTV